MQLAPGNSSVPLGKSQQFTATANYSDGSAQDVTSKATWASADPDVAAVGRSGLAVSKRQGTTAITATIDSVPGAAAITVTDPIVVSIAVEPPGVSLPLGENQQFAAIGTFSDGSKQDLTSHVTWVSSDPSIATITDTGLATAKAAGPDNIVARQTGLAGSSALTVTSAALVSIDVFPDSASVPAGKTQRFTAVGTYSDGSSFDITRSVEWMSTDPDVAKVNPSGQAKGKSPGNSAITASLQSVQGSGALKVTLPLLVSLDVTPARVSILFGKAQQFVATGTFSDGSQRDLTSIVKWSSSLPKIATVSPSGLANSKDNGTTTIGAAHAGFQSGGNLNVLPALQVNYFANVNSGLQQDATVRVTNPGSPHADLCSMIYVFDQDQQITECCGCSVTPDGLRTLSVLKDLTSNPLTGTLSTAGIVKVVAADAKTNPGCNAASFTPRGALRGWSTHIQLPDSATVAITEAEFQEALLTPHEQSRLQSQCHHIQVLGSGHGICSCGTGD